jgi:hypothetical protein
MNAPYARMSHNLQAVLDNIASNWRVNEIVLLHVEHVFFRDLIEARKKSVAPRHASARGGRRVRQASNFETGVKVGNGFGIEVEGEATIWPVRLE